MTTFGEWRAMKVPLWIKPTFQSVHTPQQHFTTVFVQYGRFGNAFAGAPVPPAPAASWRTAIEHGATILPRRVREKFPTQSNGTSPQLPSIGTRIASTPRRLNCISITVTILFCEYVATSRESEQ
jgi:hypothetical protein